MLDTHRIDLAHTDAFRLGRLSVVPQLRVLRRDDGAEEVVEPRVMQVLVALVEAKGAIVSRADLTRTCWEGRIVGDDAINRVISRLRRSAEGIGEGSFKIETVTKVGYRLLTSDAEEAADPANPADPATPPGDGWETARRLRLDRRAMLAGSGLAVLGAGGYALWRRRAPPQMPVPPEVAALMNQASIALSQGTAEGNSQGIGLLRRVTALRPDYADAWGLLALAYGAAAASGPPQYEAPMRARAIAAARRAIELDPDNAYARVAGMYQRRGNQDRLRVERELRAALARHPRNDMLMGNLGGLLLGVGRCREAALMLDRATGIAEPSPGLVYTHVKTLWAANRLEEADRAMDEAFALYPTHFAVWFTRFYLLLYTGRAAEAQAQAENRDGRPAAIPEYNFTMLLAVARAMRTRAVADVDEAMRQAVDTAHKGAGHCENAIQFASALGRIDTAFMVADAYYFAKGFDPGELRFSDEQRSYTRRDARRTHFLFFPPTAALRADPRFAALAASQGLERYWRESGTQPDYRRTG